MCQHLLQVKGGTFQSHYRCTSNVDSSLIGTSLDNADISIDLRPQRGRWHRRFNKSSALHAHCWQVIHVVLNVFVERVSIQEEANLYFVLHLGGGMQTRAFGLASAWQRADLVKILTRKI